MSRLSTGVNMQSSVGMFTFHDDVDVDVLFDD